MATASAIFDSYNFEAVQSQQALAAKRKTLAHARSGDANAFAEMVVPYASGLYRRALRMTGNPADAEDVRQDALLKAFSRLNQFAGQQDENKDDLHAWVSRITTNASIDLIRQRRDSKYSSLDEPAGPNTDETFGTRMAANTDNPEERYARKEMRKLMAGVIARLAPDLRQICLLRDVLQYSTHEVAARLGISAVAVRLRLFRAHRGLREGLRDRLRQKRLRPVTPINAARARSAALLRRTGVVPRREFVRMATQAGFACGD